MTTVHQRIVNISMSGVCLLGANSWERVGMASKFRLDKLLGRNPINCNRLIAISDVEFK